MIRRALRTAVALATVINSPPPSGPAVDPVVSARLMLAPPFPVSDDAGKGGAPAGARLRPRRRSVARGTAVPTPGASVDTRSGLLSEGPGLPARGHQDTRLVPSCPRATGRGGSGVVRRGQRVDAGARAAVGAVGDDLVGVLHLRRPGSPRAGVAVHRCGPHRHPWRAPSALAVMTVGPVSARSRAKSRRPPAGVNRPDAPGVYEGEPQGTVRPRGHGVGPGIRRGSTAVTASAASPRPARLRTFPSRSLWPGRSGSPRARMVRCGSPGPFWVAAECGALVEIRPGN